MEAFHYAALFLAFLLASTRLLKSKSKNLPPSPPSLPIIGHLHLLKKHLHRSLADLTNLYGSILFLRFGSRNVLVVSSPSLAEECFSKNDVVFANRPHLLAGKHLGYNYTTIVWAPYGQHWRNLRRITALEIFSSNRLHMFSGIRREEVLSLIKQLFRDSDREEAFKEVELKSRFFELTLNVMMRMIAGKKFYGEGMEDLDEARRFRDIVEETFSLSGASNLGDFLPVLQLIDFQGLEKRLIKLQRKRDGFLQGLIDEHRKEANGCCLIAGAEEEGGGRRKTIIDVLLSLKETDPEYYTDEVIKGVIVVLLSAGSDTSAGTMEWAMSLLVQHPEVLKKARAELDLHVGRDRVIDETDLPKLPFLHCIINETLRLHPAAPIIPAHESSEECKVGGYNVPSGTMLLVNAWAIQRDPKLWAEPESFKPERFTNLEGEKEGYRLIPFGLGRRGCPGEGLAMRVVGLALGALIQCYEWECGCEEVDMSERTGLAVSKAKPLVAFYKPRQCMAHVLSHI